MESDKIQGSDSEEEMTSKSEYIAALRMVHQLDGKFMNDFGDIELLVTIEFVIVNIRH